MMLANSDNDNDDNNDANDNNLASSSMTPSLLPLVQKALGCENCQDLDCLDWI